MNRRSLALSAMACLPFALAACAAPGRSDPLTTTNTPTKHDDGPLLPDSLAPYGPLSASLNPQEQQQADEIVAAWFQESVKAEYNIIDKRIIVFDADAVWSSLNGGVGVSLHKTGIETTANHPSLPHFLDFPPAQDRHDQGFQGWRKQIGPKSDMMSNTYEVTAPHAAVVAVVYLEGVAPGHRSILALFELKPTPGQG